MMLSENDNSKFVVVSPFMFEIRLQNNCMSETNYYQLLRTKKKMNIVLLAKKSRK